nr:MAG TPA: hypothetical protein [Caudoviricetes sp.]
MLSGRGPFFSACYRDRRSLSKVRSHFKKLFHY